DQTGPDRQRIAGAGRSRRLDHLSWAAGSTSKAVDRATAAWSAPCRIPFAWFATGACSTTPCGLAPRSCRPCSHRRRPPKSCCYARSRRRTFRCRAAGKRAGKPPALLLVDGRGERHAVEPRLGRRGRGMMRVARPEDDRLALAFPGAAKVGDRALLRRRGAAVSVASTTIEASFDMVETCLDRRARNAD